MPRLTRRRRRKRAGAVGCGAVDGARFRDNAIDADVLCDLTDGHLRQLGLSLGARLKLLRPLLRLVPASRPFLRTYALRFLGWQ
jgi:hypothetical protein